MWRKKYPSDLSEQEWQLIKPLLPDESSVGHPREVNLREIVDAIFYVQREGCSWRALPGDFPAWLGRQCTVIYVYCRKWGFGNKYMTA